MDKIQTVCGLLDADQVTGADSHTHLIAYALPELIEKDPDLLLDSVDALREDIETFKSLGGNLIAEMTTADYCSDTKKLQEISEKYQIHVIASAGFNKGIYNRRYLEHYSMRTIFDRLMRDTDEGMDGVPAGLLKIGTSLNEITPWEEKGIRAVSAVHHETGFPISTHTQNGTMALEQMKLFQAEGIPMKDVILCHLDQCEDFSVHQTVLSAGAYLSYDSVAKPKYRTRERALKFIAECVRLGYQKQLLVGNDFARRSCYKGYGGTIGYESLFKDFREEIREELKKAGFTSRKAEEVIRDIYTENPKHAFSIRYEAIGL